jgi:segregation and condensation protein B
VLFLARESLSTRRIAQLANLADATEARTLLGQLSRCYDDQGRAIQLEQVAGGFRLLTRPQFAPWITKLSVQFHPESADLKLTPPALDTLVVVAYRQPVLRAEIEAIRGVGCGELLRQLIERDLLRIFGRSEELGRPLLYGTTKRFLQTFGLKNLADLPRIDELDPARTANPATEARIERKAA